MGKSVGLFGGSFDPIHFGHLNMAVQMREIHQLDEIWLCPTNQNPLKHPIDAGNSPHRLKMLLALVENVPWLKVIDYEIHQSSPCYTIDTLKKLHAEFPDHKFSLILGKDTALAFYRWKTPEAILQYATLLVGQRLQEMLKKVEGSESVIKALEKGETHTTLMEISSTDIRHRLNNKLFCGHLIPAKVLDYILSNRLYL